MQNDVFKEWVVKAEGDFRTATRESKVMNQPYYDAVCFHAQQFIEKYLKVFRVFHGLNYKCTHALIPLLEDCIIIDPTFEFIRQQCDDITGLDQFRYPSDFANLTDAKLALRSAKIARNFVREKLGITRQPTRRN